MLNDSGGDEIRKSRAVCIGGQSSRGQVGPETQLAPQRGPRQPAELGTRDGEDRAAVGFSGEGERARAKPYGGHGNEPKCRMRTKPQAGYAGKSDAETRLRESHDVSLVAVGIDPRSEGHVVTIEAEQTLVADGHAACVTAKERSTRLGCTESGLGADDRVVAKQAAHQGGVQAGKMAGVGPDGGNQGACHGTRG